MKSLLLLLAIATTASATSIRQENGPLLGGAYLPPRWTHKYVTLDKEGATAVFDLLSKLAKVTKDGEDGLSSESVQFEDISCRRETSTIQGADRGEDYHHVVTTCTLQIDYGISAMLYKSATPGKFRVELSSPALLKAMQTNSDVKLVTENRGGKDFSYANGVVTCKDNGYIDCSVIESIN